jgi:hypothetical protein
LPFYRKKPVVIEAHRYMVENADEIVRWADGAVKLAKTEMKMYPYIDTLEGKMLVSPGDYVIKGVNGEFYPCKPDIFVQTYEEVEEADADRS